MNKSIILFQVIGLGIIALLFNLTEVRALHELSFGFAIMQTGFFVYYLYLREKENKLKKFILTFDDISFCYGASKKGLQSNTSVGVNQ